jgi:ATP-dependent Zn protease
MSDFYKMRKELQAAGRSKEKEMRDTAVRAVTTPVRTVGSNIAEDFRGGLEQYQASQEELFRPRDTLLSGETAEDIGYGTLNELTGMTRMLTSPITGVVRSALPMETIGEAVSAATPESVKQLAAEYPRQAQAVGNIAELAGIRGGGQLAKSSGS